MCPEGLTAPVLIPMLIPVLIPMWPNRRAGFAIWIRCSLRESPCYTTFPRWRRTIFGVHQADSPKQVLRFRPVIAEHPILCEDIDMGRDAELRRVRWAGSLRSIICKTNVFTKKIEKKSMLYNLSTCAPGWFYKKVHQKSLNGSKLDEIWELEDEKNTYRMNFHEESDSELKSWKFRVFLVGTIFWAEKHLSIFLYFPDRKSQNRLATFGRVRTNVPRSVAHWFWILRIPGRLA